METINVGIIQISTKKLDLDYNFKESIKSIKIAKKKGADIVVTPECMLDGYSFDSIEFQRNPLNYTIDLNNSNYIERYKKLCSDLKIYAIIGLSLRERKQNKRLSSKNKEDFSNHDGFNPKSWIFRNAALLINPEGEILGKYYKIHSTYENLEADFYKHGENLPVFIIKKSGFEFKIGIMICYDRQVPETARILRIKGAEIIFNPAATGNFARKWNTHLIETRAYENKCFIVSVNHAFPRINGRSFIANPNGKVIKRCFPWKCVSVVNLDLKKVIEKQHDLKTRRPSVYSEILKN